MITECTTCDGRGVVACKPCCGDGYVPASLEYDGREMDVEARCDHCEGTGERTCLDCDGEGEIDTVEPWTAEDDKYDQAEERGRERKQNRGEW